MTDKSVFAFVCTTILVFVALLLPENAAAQNCSNMLSSCSSNLINCNDQLNAAFGKGDWRDQLPGLLESAVQELVRQGVTLSQSTRDAAKSKDLQVQLAALSEVASAAAKLPAKTLKGSGATSKLDHSDATHTLQRQTVAPQQLNQSVKLKNAQTP